jgi:hypothetical protein
MPKKPPKRQPTNEVLRNARARQRGKYHHTTVHKGKESGAAKREKTLLKNADRAVKRQAAQKKKTAVRKKPNKGK